MRKAISLAVLALLVLVANFQTIQESFAQEDGQAQAQAEVRSDLNRTELIKLIALTPRDGRINLRGVSLRQVSLQGLSLNGANLVRSDLRGVNATFADFSGADLTNANMINGIFANANFLGANFNRTNLQRTNLTGANLMGAVFSEAVFNENVTLPDGTKWAADTDMGRFTNPQHPSFWRSDDPQSPAR